MAGVYQSWFCLPSYPGPHSLVMTRGGSACIHWSCPEVQCVLKTSQQRRETGEPCVILTVLIPPQEGARKTKVLRLRVFSPEEDPEPCSSGLHGETDWEVVLVGLGAHSSCDLVTVTTPRQPHGSAHRCSQSFASGYRTLIFSNPLLG